MYVIGYPRSGNTWICYMLSYCLNVEYDDYDAPGIHPSNPAERALVKGGHGHKSHSASLGGLYKTHDTALMASDEKRIYLVRDARDVMTSYYYYMKCRDSGISGFDEFLQAHLPEWTAHTENACKADLIIRYEDMQSDTLGTLRSVFESLSADVDDAVIEECARLFSFENLSGRKKGDTLNTEFFRSGTVGDWVNTFSQTDLEYFKHTASAHMRKLGYELV
jgi:hypothetical protein